MDIFQIWLHILLLILEKSIVTDLGLKPYCDCLMQVLINSRLKL